MAFAIILARVVFSWLTQIFSIRLCCTDLICFTMWFIEMLPFGWILLGMPTIFHCASVHSSFLYFVGYAKYFPSTCLEHISTYKTCIHFVFHIQFDFIVFNNMSPTPKRKADKDVSTGKAKKNLFAVHFVSDYNLELCDDKPSAEELMKKSSVDTKDLELLCFPSYEKFNEKFLQIKTSQVESTLKTYNDMIKVNSEVTAQNKLLTSRLAELESKTSSKQLKPSPKTNPPVPIVSPQKLLSPKKSANDGFNWKALRKPQPSNDAAGTDAPKPLSLMDAVMEKRNNEGMSCNVYWFNKTPTEVSHNVIMYDFVDTRKQTIHWCHRPHLWQVIFKTDFIFPLESQQLTNFFHQTRACKQRAKKGGPNAQKVVEVNNPGGSYDVRCVGLYRGIGKDLDENAIKELLIDNWRLILVNADIMGAYHREVEDTSRSKNVIQETLPLFPKDAKNPGPYNPNAQYWNRLNGCLHKEKIKVIQVTSLNEMFMDEDIQDILMVTGNDIHAHMFTKTGWNIPKELYTYVGLSKRESKTD